MFALAYRSMVRRAAWPTVILLLLTCRAWAVDSDQDAPAPETPAGNLVQKALESELAGDNQQRQALLQDALHQSPGNEAAHWQSGDVRVQGDWQSAAEAARLARQNQRLAEYLRRRDKAESTVEAQANLARWCRKNHLDDQARVHWQTVLQLQPGNSEAIQGLSLRPYHGMLLTPSQILQLKNQARELRKATDRLQPMVAQWLAAFERHEPTSSIAVLEKAKTSGDRLELLALDNELWRQIGAKKRSSLYQDSSLYQEMSIALINTLHDNQSPAAAESLARYAIFSESKAVRDAVTKELKPRPKDHYVPLLISGLQSPIQLTPEYFFTPAGFAVLRESIYREGAIADYSTSLWFTRMAALRPPPPPGEVKNQAVDMVYNGLMQKEGFSRQVLADIDDKMHDAVDTVNRDVILQQNARITEVLRNIMDVDMGKDPIPWATWWWRDYNEQFYPYDYDGSKKPVYSSNSVTCTMPSCFAPGTKVWTLSGLTPIEQIRQGDSVLSQDIDSGELAYKPVLATTIREPGPRAKISVGSESIVATPGHPFWIDGQGWRLTKQLNPGERFHTLSGSASIESVEKLEGVETECIPAYNLIVADFNSYFVGEQGILVHDNTPRQPTATLVPGLVAVKRDEAIVAAK